MQEEDFCWWYKCCLERGREEGVAKAEVLVLSPGARQLTGNARKTKKEEQKLDSQEQSRK